MGKSSGGFGAMITPMLRPDLFGALATHAGDTLYEYCYIPEFAAAVRHLRRYDGDIWRWWETSRPGWPSPSRRTCSLLGAARRGRVLLRPRGRHRGAAVRPGDRGAPAGRVAALAGLGPGADGARATRTPCGGCAAIWIDAGTRDEYQPRRRRRRRSVPRSRDVGVSRRPGALRALRRRAHAASTIVTRCRWRGSAAGWLSSGQAAVARLCFLVVSGASDRIKPIWNC